jgi:hypothetical protein
MTESFLQPSTHRRYRCQCGRPVFFGNSECLACGTPLGYVVETADVTPLAPATAPDSWRRFGDASAGAPNYYRCANFFSPAGCNWMVDAAEHDGGQAYCVACRLNRTIPDLHIADNGELWRRVEAAKRRLVSSLLALGLPLKSREGEDPERGVSFDFLRGPFLGKPVMTGHLNGLITLNIEEADDAKREKVRIAMHEPYRTLLGHLRHEIGHYYWDRLISGTSWIWGFRDLFGDETRDYAAALEWQYRNGPPEDWQQYYVSSYAASHPHEDWAETWAHFLHMVDMLDTAASFGLVAENVELDIEPFGDDVLYQGEPADRAEFLRLVNAATKLTGVLNEMSRSMGQPDFYPFVLSNNAVRKLYFVHQVVRQFKPAQQTALPPVPEAASATAAQASVDQAASTSSSPI